MIETTTEAEIRKLEALWNEKTDHQLLLDRQLREVTAEIDAIANRIAMLKTWPTLAIA